MKKLFYFVPVLLVLFSCSTDTGEETQYVVETIPVREVVFPLKYATDSITEIPVKFFLQSNCAQLKDFYYVKDGNIRTVAVQTIRLVKNTCSTNVYSSTATLSQGIIRFKPVLTGTYHFKFWKGTNATTLADEYLEFDAAVTH